MKAGALALSILGTLCLAAGQSYAVAQQADAPETQRQPSSPIRPGTSSATEASPAGSASAIPSGAARPATTPKQKREADKAYMAGAKALEGKDLHAALAQFNRAASLDPDHREYSIAAEIAKAHLVTELVEQAEKARILGHPETALAKLSEALHLDPNNPEVAQHVDDLAALERDAPPDKGAEAEIAGAIRLNPSPDTHSFQFRGDAATVLKQVLAAYGIIAVVDPSVRVLSVRFEADEVNYAQAAQMLRLATDSFFVPLDPKRVLIAKDTRENRRKYERLLMETVYLPGLSSTQMSDMGNLARNVFDAQQSTVQPNARTLTVRAPETKLNALNRTLADLLDGKSQLLLDFRILEVARTRDSNLGIQPPQQFSAFNIPSQLNTIIQGNQSLIQQIVASGLAPANDLAAIAGVLIASGQVSNSILNTPFATFGNGLTLTGLTLGSPSANLALNTSDTRSIDDVQLHVQDGEAGTIMAGSRYPIIQSSYSNLGGISNSIPGLNTAGLSSQLAALGLSAADLASQQATIPQVQYEDLGLTLKATPRVLRNGRIALKLQFKLQALAGQSLNSIPVLTNREFTADLETLDGQSTLVSGVVTRSEALAVSGIPGLDELPGFRSGTNQEATYNSDNLVILITPHITRREHTDVAGPVLLLPSHQ